MARLQTTVNLLASFVLTFTVSFSFYAQAHDGQGVRDQKEKAEKKITASRIKSLDLAQLNHLVSMFDAMWDHSMNGDEESRAPAIVTGKQIGRAHV